jgi:hypothetical protein
MKSGGMAMIWSSKEESHLLNVIPDYRQNLEGKSLRQARSLTLSLAEEIHQVPEVNHRSVEAINQRIPYLENLLAGAFEKHHYAKKDQHLYFTSPRDNNSKKPNLCNTRHPYNGALREYLDKLKKNPHMDGDFVI